MYRMYMQALSQLLHDIHNLRRLFRDRHWTGNGSCPKMPAYRRKLARIAVRNLRQSLSVLRAYGMVVA